VNNTEQGNARPGQNSLFRAAALKRLNSPEQLDERVRFIPPAMRLMAMGAALIIVAGLVWAVYGSIPTRASGRGVLLSDGKGSFAVEPVTSGPVTEVLVKQGDRVPAGTVIARIKQASLSAQLKGATMRLEAVQEDLARLKTADAAILATSEHIAHRSRPAVEKPCASFLRQCCWAFFGEAASGSASTCVMKTFTRLLAVG
jgi:HlyD family secretion protein